MRRLAWLAAVATARAAPDTDTLLGAIDRRVNDGATVNYG